MTQIKNDPHFASYRALLNKVEAKYRQIQGNHSAEFSCKKGCFHCCSKDLSVFQVEKEHMRAYLQARPGLVKRIEQNEISDPHQGAYCKFLDQNGSCLVYEVRPVICRSHGAPVKYRNEAATDRRPPDEQLSHDVCPLNFRGQEVNKLPSEMFINLETLNTLLSLIDGAYCQSSEGKRYRLSLREIMQA